MEIEISMNGIDASEWNDEMECLWNGIEEWNRNRWNQIKSRMMEE